MNRTTLMNALLMNVSMMDDATLNTMVQMSASLVGGQNSMNSIVSSSQTNYVANAQNTTNTTTPSTTTEEKKQYIATKDFIPQYKVEEMTAKDGTKLFCISRKNGWTKAEKSLMNTAIKALKGIKEIEVEADFKKKDGTTYKGTYKAWGFNTDATAKKHLKELPTVFTVAQLNGEV